MFTLTPGSWYFLFTCESCKSKQVLFSDLSQGKSVKAEHVLSIRIDKADLVSRKSFVYVIENNYAHVVPPFDRNHQAWLNYHYRVFRAKAPRWPASSRLGNE